MRLMSAGVLTSSSRDLLLETPDSQFQMFLWYFKARSRVERKSAAREMVVILFHAATLDGLPTQDLRYESIEAHRY